MAINHGVIFKFENQGGEGCTETANPFAFLDCLRTASPTSRRLSVQKYGAALRGAGASRLRVTYTEPPQLAPGRASRLSVRERWRRPTWDRRLPAERFLPLPDTEEPPRWPLPTRARGRTAHAAQRGMRPPRGRG